MSFTSKKVILFDLDGVLTDSGEGIINSVKFALTYYDIRKYDEKLLNKFIGPPLIESFMEIFGFSGVKAREAVEKYREYFREKGIYENNLYNGIEQLLKDLVANGKKLVLATSKPEVFALKILEYFNILNYFSAVAGSELDGTRIKKDEVIKYALKKYGDVDLSYVVMVGDREYDIFGSKKAGIDSIGVLYGYGDYDELKNAGATLIVETVDQLKNVLLG